MAEPLRNVLKERRKESDIIWAFRELKPVEPYNAQHSTEHLHNLCDKVLALVVAQDTEEGTYEDKQRTASKIKSMMEEMRCSYNQPLLRCLGIIFSKLLKHFYSGVLVNEKSITKIKNVMGNAPVILVPSHRSYCDFIIMAYICFAFEIEIPCVAAAIDFSSMKVIGNMLRNCKAFFIRRNFNSNLLYKNTFQRFLQYLVIYGNSPVEFFIEGTRSRTGKALPPKFGLLKTIVDTFTENDVPDLMILPAGISYDRVVEDVLFSYELLGIPKPPESTKGFFKALSTMDEKYGNIYINMGEAIYLKSFLTKHSLTPWTADSGYFLEFLGFHIIKEQQKLQKILCIHLLSLVLHDQYMRNGSILLQFTSACSHISALKSLLKVFGADTCLSDNITEDLNDCLTIHKSLIELSHDNVIKLSTFDVKTSELQGKKLKGANLTEDILSSAIPMLCIQQYVNPLFTVLAAPVLLIALVQYCSSYDKLFEKFTFFRDIFSNEFIFIKEHEEKEFQSSIDNLLKLDMIEIINENNIILKKGNKYSFTLSSILYPYIIAYLCTCRILLVSSEKLTIENIFKSCQLLIGERIKKCYDYHHASLSLDSIGLAVSTMFRLQAISKENGCDTYMVNNVALLHYIFDELDLLLRSFDFYWKEENIPRSLSQCKL